MPTQWAFDQRTGHLLLQLGRIIEQGIAAAAAPIGLRPRHLHVLALVAEGPLSQRELSQRSGYDRTTMVAVIDELENRELVRRHRGEQDRRRFFIVPTEQGEETLAAALLQLQAGEDGLFGALSGPDRSRLDGLLRKLIAAVEG